MYVFMVEKNSKNTRMSTHAFDLKMEQKVPKIFTNVVDFEIRLVEFR